jgi:hypothetical protein
MTLLEAVALVWWSFGLAFVPWSLKRGAYAPVPFVWDSVLDVPLWLTTAWVWPLYAFAHWKWGSK